MKKIFTTDVPPAFKMPGQYAYFSIQPLSNLTDLQDAPVGEEMFEICLVSRGKATLTLPESRPLLTANSFYCTSRNRHNRVEAGKDTEGFLIRFNQALILSGDREFAGLYFPVFQVMSLRKEVIRLEDTAMYESMKLCEMMRVEFETQTNFKLQILSGFMNVLLFNLMRKINRLRDDPDDGRRFLLIQRFNVLLEKNFRTNKKVSDYAALLSITPSYLNLAIKKATGNSASSHIRRRVIMEAIRKVNLTGASLKEVACDLGFSDYAHFSKFFKKGSGKNFSEVKKYELTSLEVYPG
ncbi:helix-turn-helix domain-containing protein [Terrimonas sp. NA20]|uniref:Helix-turn-helix domain-containing protein n=1 Tax=Terrimonas ginsenosidimutans TaxID=2908004 RepID=A0ABS9KS68_9BACT|nr:helix-turn-helix domain-containing protein [Terrimonas ginsenosidimutans]MCG2615181.1 helix-turn-helix domain-containing protein [Terrimonas ginsenosidimutans]